MTTPDNSLSIETVKETLTTSTDVMDLYLTLEKLGIQIWIDGGWGVDALLDRQTRPHKDVDIAIQEKDLPKFREYLEGKKYQDIKIEQSKPWNFVLGDDKGHEIEVHVVVLDDKGNGIYGPMENGQMYPAESLTGSGIIDNQTVRCISPEWMIKFHSGYELKDKDFQDVSALCEKYNIPLPEEYKHFTESR
jgi:lincosamide nucleotidyltransferase A/C/D/E